jgi:hypothetical protein
MKRGALLACWLLVVGCRVDATVGYNEGALIGGKACETDALARCENGACAVTDLFDAPHGAITLQADDTQLFFLNTQFTLAKRPIAGGATTELATTDTPLMRMTSDATHVYWIEQDGKLRGVPKAGGAFFEASYVFGNPTDITVDAAHLYWVLPDLGQVAMAAKPMGPATHISGQNWPTAITTDGAFVYWVNAGNLPNTGELMRAERGNLKTAELLLTELEAPVAIAAAGGDVYWASSSSVFRLASGETAAETLARDLMEIKQLGVVGGAVYGVGMDGFWTIPVAGGERTTLHPRPMSAMAVACSGVFSSHWLEDGLERYGP